MNKIIFIPTTKDVELMVDSPKPAKSCIPEWFKEITAVNYKNVKINEQGLAETNVKNCIPFLDSITSGYIQQTWADISIRTDNNGNVMYSQSNQSFPMIMGQRPHTSLPVSESYYPFEFFWSQPWLPKLPLEYSYLFVNPLNRPEIPFYTTSAIVDGDKLNYTTNGITPFYIKNGFEGIIPKGTPMFQIIPFKREIWGMETEEFNDDLTRSGLAKLRSKYLGFYKDNYWSKKEYS
jgi:hypothetical protein